MVCNKTNYKSCSGGSRIGLVSLKRLFVGAGLIEEVNNVIIFLDTRGAAATESFPLDPLLNSCTFLEIKCSRGKKKRVIRDSVHYIHDIVI